VAFGYRSAALLGMSWPKGEEARVARLARQVLRKLGVIAAETPPASDNRRKASLHHLSGTWIVL
jgi:hypothetical protein